MKKRKQPERDREGRDKKQQAALREMLKQLDTREYHLPKRAVKNQRAKREITSFLTKELLS